MQTSINTLVINSHLPSILALIRNNEVTQINAPTGSGKSIGIPLALAESGAQVFVSVPTRVSATSLSSYARSLNSKLSIGYAADAKTVYDDNTDLVYATSGHMRRKMLRYFASGINSFKYGLLFTDVLVVDETHTGSLDNTIILSLWMHARQLGVKVPKLVLLSATPTNIPIKPEPIVYAVPVPAPFPVEVIYDARDMDDSVYDHAAEIAISLHNDSRMVGGFLIFVPGAREVDELVNNLKEQIEDAIILPAYGTLDSEELNLIYNPTETRKIVVATNIAESSITIPDLVAVIDTLKCKEATATRSGAIRLETVIITKDSAQQRLGRVGRTCPGKCYRLINNMAYDRLDEHRQPEIERLPLHNTVMELLQAQINPTEVICGIDPYRVIESIGMLTRLGMVEEKDSKDQVTECGQFAPSVPLGVRNAAFLWRWIKLGYPLYPGIVIASIIDTHSAGFFFIPRKPKNLDMSDYPDFCNKHIEKIFNRWIGETPLHTYLNMWRALMNQIGRGHYQFIKDPYTYNYRRWSRDNSTNYKQLNDLVSTVSQVYRVTNSQFKHVDVLLFDTDSMIAKAVPILQDIYSDNTICHRYNGMFHRGTSVRHVFDERRTISTIERLGRAQTNNLIALATHEIVTKTGSAMGYMDIFIMAPKPVLSDSFLSMFLSD